MGIYDDIVKGFADYDDIVRGLDRGQHVVVSGCIDSCKAHLISGFTAGRRLLVTYDEVRGRQLLEELKFFGIKGHYYPAKDVIFFNANVHGNVIVSERIAAIKALFEEEASVIVTTIDGLVDKIMPPDVMREAVYHIDLSSIIDTEKLIEKLTYLGYMRMPQVEMSGEFSVRGSIIDIFPFAEELPVRIDLWDEEVDSIRSFDPESQRSVENLEGVNIYPAREILIKDVREGIDAIQEELKKHDKVLLKKKNIEASGRINKIVRELVERIENEDATVGYESLIGFFAKKTSTLLDYFDAGDVIVLDEPVRLVDKLDVTMKEFSESMTNRLMRGYILPTESKSVIGKPELLALLDGHVTLSLSMIDGAEDMVSVDIARSLTTKNINSYNQSFEMLVKDIKTYKKNGYGIVLVSNSATRAKRLAEDLGDNDVISFYSTDSERTLLPGEVMVTSGNIRRGFEYPLSKVVIIAESDIFGREKKKRVAKKKLTGKSIADFNELTIGDYVVHENHGIGIYKGIEKVTVDKITKDYIKIEYADGGNLYILATQLDVIQKYAGAEAKKPKLNKLNDVTWSRTKSRVKTAVNEVAKDLVELYATRQNMRGYSYSPDGPWQREFEEMFPYDETDDQLEAIRATKEDMESTKVMDRLICGDVGFGKTEIAIRAAFKAVTDGKQVAYLVPTTILAQQHYNTFVQRMKDFAVRIDLLSRFATPKQAADTIEGLKRGTVDIVVGTHKLLSKSVSFKNLGLLIIDEEQRFGVSHKEKIKKLRNDVDVLTLSATPIPRTLHMSLAGIRDMSVLEEPPVDRMPIQTFVTEYDEEMIREAINRELSRNGQVYYVYNRVNTIGDIAAKIASLVPEANVAYAHGQMGERNLERIMLDFINGDIDVLVSTTIIETGLDIPNVNTIIIHDSDNFGLSQLYQLRGRVGRSNRTAYAFLLYKRDKLLRETAEKRLHAIREFTELGSGIKIAMKDLEIRGAGNVLGEAQHGHMAEVGYDLYCKMLNEAVDELKGVRGARDFETTIDVDVDAYIPATYIKSESQKLDIYKRIASIETEDEKSDMIDELTDRFGDIPKSAMVLLNISLIKSMAHDAYIMEIKGNRNEVRFCVSHGAPVNSDGIPRMIEHYRRRLKFIGGNDPVFAYIPDKDEGRDAESFLEAVKRIVGEIRALQE